MKLSETDFQEILDLYEKAIKAKFFIPYPFDEHEIDKKGNVTVPDKYETTYIKKRVGYWIAYFEDTFDRIPQMRPKVAEQEMNDIQARFGSGKYILPPNILKDEFIRDYRIGDLKEHLTFKKRHTDFPECVLLANESQETFAHLIASIQFWFFLKEFLEKNNGKAAEGQVKEQSKSENENEYEIFESLKQNELLTETDYLSLTRQLLIHARKEHLPLVEFFQKCEAEFLPTNQDFYPKILEALSRYKPKVVNPTIKKETELRMRQMEAVKKGLPVDVATSVGLRESLLSSKAVLSIKYSNLDNWKQAILGQIKEWSLSQKQSLAFFQYCLKEIQISWNDEPIKGNFTIDDRWKKRIVFLESQIEELEETQENYSNASQTRIESQTFESMKTVTSMPRQQDEKFDNPKLLEAIKTFFDKHKGDFFERFYGGGEEQENLSGFSIGILQRLKEDAQYKDIAPQRVLEKIEARIKKLETQKYDSETKLIEGGRLIRQELEIHRLPSGEERRVFVEKGNPSEYSARVLIFMYSIEIDFLKWYLKNDLQAATLEKPEPSKSNEEKKPELTKDKSNEILQNLKAKAQTHLALLNGYNPLRKKIMKQVDFDKLVGYVDLMIQQEQLPENIEQLDQIAIPTGHIRYLFYCIHKDLYTTRRIRDYFIDFLHCAFKQFEVPERSTTKTKFSLEPKSWKQDLEVMRG